MRNRAIGGLLLVLLMLAASLLWLRDGDDAVTSPAAGPPQPAAAPDVIAGRQRPEQAEPERAAVPAAAAKTLATIRGRVVRAEDGSPLPGCEVRLRGWLQGERWLEQHLLPAELMTFEGRGLGEMAPAHTGVDGRFALTFDLPPANQLQLAFACEGRIPLQATWDNLAPGASEDLGDVAMARGCLVHGDVVDTKGTPQPDVRLVVSRDPTPPLDRRGGLRIWTHTETRSRADGTFAFRDHFVAGTWLLYAIDRQKVEPHAIRIREDQIEATAHVVLMRPDDVESITGRVLDEHGRGIAQAIVSREMATRDPHLVRSQADGSFRLERRPRDPRGPFPLTASATGHEATVVPALDWGARDVEFVLRAGLGATLIVRAAASGEPVELYGVRLWQGDRATGPLQHCGRHAGGKTALGDLRRATYSLVVVPGVERLLPSARLDFTIADGPMPNLEILLHAPEVRTVQVRRLDGTPIAGTRVELLEPGSGSVTLQTFASPLEAEVRASGSARLLAQGTTGPDGRLEMKGPPEPPLTVRVFGDGHSPALVAGVLWRAAEGPLVVEVATGATLVGRLGPEEAVRGHWEAATPYLDDRDATTKDKVVPYGAPHVQLSRPAGSRTERHPPFSLNRAIVARDGTFTVSGIPPGTWTVLLWHRRKTSPSSSITRDQYLGTVANLRDGETRTFHATLDSALPALFGGEVQVDDQPFAGNTVYLHGQSPAGQRLGSLTHTDALGRFQVAVDAGTWRLTLSSLSGVTLPVPGEVALLPGEVVSRTFKVATGELRLRLVRTDGKTPVAGVVVMAELPGSRWMRWLPKSDTSGSTRLDQLPRAVLNLRCRPVHLADAAAWDAYTKANPNVWRDALLDLGEIDVTTLAEPATVIVPTAAGY